MADTPQDEKNCPDGMIWDDHLQICKPPDEHIDRGDRLIPEAMSLLPVDKQEQPEQRQQHEEK